MDQDTAEIRRKIAEARAVQKRLAEMQNRIRQQHHRLEDVIRGFNEEDRPHPEPLEDRLARERRTAGRGPSQI